MSRPVLTRRALPTLVGGGVAAAVLATAAISYAAGSPASPHAGPDVATVVNQPGGVGSDAVPGGFPTAATTGVPVGTRLTSYTGPTTISKAGSVISDKIVEGCLTVAAKNVTIRDSVIRCSRPRPVLSLVGASVHTTVTRVELDGTGVASVGLGAHDVVADGLNIHGSADGVHLARHAVLVNSYVHDLSNQPTLHHDALQTLHGSAASGIRVMHNTLQAWTPSRQDNTVYHMGSGAISDIVVSGNFMDGGHYMVQIDNGAQQHDIVFRGNTMGRHYHYGLLFSGTHAGTAVDFVGNRWLDTGRAATPANSKGAGQMR